MSNHVLEDLRTQRKVVFCVAAAGFVFQFETFMVNVALPTIAGELNASTTEISFVVLAYLIAATATFIPAGKLADIVGLKKVFIASTLAAMGGTLLCGFSPDLRVLVASRAVQGVGAGGMAALGYAMIPAWLPEEKTGWGYGYLNMATGLGMLAGAPFGGLISQYASWRWVFISNAPVIALLTISALRHLPADSPVQKTGVSFDIAGTVMFSAILVAGVFSLSLGSELGWTSPPILTSVLVAAALLAAMTIRRNILHRSFLSPGMFANPGFAASLAVLFLVRMALGGTIFLLPFYLAAFCGASAVGSSLILLAYPVAYAPVGPRAGRLADRMGSRRLVLSATLLGAVVCASFSRLLGGGNVAISVAFLLAMGVSTGIFFSPNYKYSMQCVPQEGKGEAAALIPLALNSGTVFGISVFETVFSLDFPEGAAYLKQAERISGSAPMESLSGGFSNAFLVGFGVLLAAAAIAFLTYKTSSGANRD
jgi:EmrB/QacA subfamily drug resistance transporter